MSKYFFSIYRGFGYVEKTMKIESPNDYMNCITSMKDNRDTKRILNSYLKNNPDKLVPLDENILLDSLQFDLLSNSFT